MVSSTGVAPWDRRCATRWKSEHLVATYAEGVLALPVRRIGADGSPAQTAMFL